MNFEWLRDNYEYSLRDQTWYAKGARVVMRNDEVVDEPARLPFPPFGITDRMLAELDADA